MINKIILKIESESNIKTRLANRDLIGSTMAEVDNK